VSQLPVINNSAIKTYRSCPRKHYFAYELGRRPIAQAGTLHFGTVIHHALEHWWTLHVNVHDDRPLVVALDTIDKSDLDDFEKAKARVLMTLYHEHWKGQGYEVLAVEANFVTKLLNPETGGRSRTWDLTGTIDAIARERSTGDVYVVEHKTSGEDLSPEADYWVRLRMDSQISTYMVGARELGFEPVGVLYDVIGKPAIKPKLATPEDKRKYTKPTKKDPKPRLYSNQRETDETPEEYEARLVDHVTEDCGRFLARARIPRLEEDEREAAADLWMATQEILMARRFNARRRNVDACQLYGRRCPYHVVCRGDGDINDPYTFKDLEA
jgi:PD-(D/E)XK nuclease superfamily